MEDTYNIKAIVLDRKSCAESDSRVVVYSREAGKLELMARGAKKIKSKLAGHLEPFNLTDIMAVHGKKYDYVGGASSQNCYSGIKNDLAKLAQAGRSVKNINDLIKPGLADEKIFDLIISYFDALEKSKKGCGTISSIFMLNFLSYLGQKPELTACLVCAGKIKPGKNKFNLARGGLVCPVCADLKAAHQAIISDNAIKLLKLALRCNFKEFIKIKIDQKTEKEFEKIIELFFQYNFN